MKFIIPIVVLFICTYFVYESAKFEIGDNDQVVITQFGKVSGPAYMIPGEYFKLPIIQKANYYKKNQILSEIKHEIPTKEYEIIFWQSKCFWRIIDPIKYYQNLNSYKLAKDYVFDIVAYEERTIVTTHILSEITMTDGPDSEGDYKCQYGLEEEIINVSQPKLNEFGIKFVSYEAKIKNTGRKIIPNKTLNADG